MIASSTKLMQLVADGLARRTDGVPIVVDLVSIGLHLGGSFLRYKSTAGLVPLPYDLETEVVPVTKDGAISFPPGAAILASSLEFVAMPLDYMGFIQTKGTIARGFVTVHVCDGQIDPGFEGQITLELVNLSNIHYELLPGVPIAQLFLHQLSSPVEYGYSGQYQLSQGPTSMRSFKIQRKVHEE